MQLRVRAATVQTLAAPTSNDSHTRKNEPEMEISGDGHVTADCKHEDRYGRRFDVIMMGLKDHGVQIGQVAPPVFTCACWSDKCPFIVRMLFDIQDSFLFIRISSPAIPLCTRNIPVYYTKQKALNQEAPSPLPAASLPMPDEGRFAAAAATSHFQQPSPVLFPSGLPNPRIVACDSMAHYVYTVLANLRS